MSIPSKRMRPPVHRTRPEIVLRSVDFPAPFGPMMVTISLSLTRSDKSVMIFTRPYPEYTWSSCSKSILLSQIGLHDGWVPSDFSRGPLGNLEAEVQHLYPIAHIHHKAHMVLHHENRNP